MTASPRATASVALDIGAGYGALIVHTTPDRLGEEIEVAREQDGLRTHVAVLAHDIESRTVHVAVFGSLPEGTYRLVGSGGERPITIAGGAITEIRGVDLG
jgi:hypothetical protein